MARNEWWAVQTTECDICVHARYILIWTFPHITNVTTYVYIQVLACVLLSAGYVHVRVQSSLAAITGFSGVHVKEQVYVHMHVHIFHLTFALHTHNTHHTHSLTPSQPPPSPLGPAVWSRQTAGSSETRLCKTSQRFPSTSDLSPPQARCLPCGGRREFSVNGNAPTLGVM